MVSGMLTVAAAFAWLGAAAHHGASYAGAILPPVALWGFGLGLTVTPLTAAVLAAVGDPDLGEASAINDAASRLGGVIAIAAVPAVIGATGGQQSRGRPRRWLSARDDRCRGVDRGCRGHRRPVRLERPHGGSPGGAAGALPRLPAAGLGAVLARSTSTT
jgi:hypothetical protein